MKTIVLALDGSEGSRRATPVAVSLAQQSKARIVIVHIDQQIAAKGDWPSVRVDENEIFERVNDEAKAIADEGVETSVERSVVLLGGPAHAIAEIANEADADVIVVGTRGYAAVAGVMLGSVTTRLLHIAKRPILAVPPAE